jgi:hypothetical protein
VVSDRQGLELPLPLESGAEAAVAELAAWSRRGVKIRSRALVTTLWARLALGDLFLHGIGGAKYDQVTDRLIERFFGLQPPGIMVLSATLYLPVPSPQGLTSQAREVKRQLRELEFHPEKFLSGTPVEAGKSHGENSFKGTGASPAAGPSSPLPPAVRELVEAKRRWIETVPDPSNAYERWRSFRRINAALGPWVNERRERLLRSQAELQRALRDEKILRWREYGFCLYPERILRDFLGELLPKHA